MTSAKARRSWITVVGWSPMAVINTLWQACEHGVVPDRIVLLASPDEQRVQQSLRVVHRYLRAILRQYGISEPYIHHDPIDESDFLGFWDTLERVLDRESQLAERLVIDTTAGRKYMSAFAITQGWRSDLPMEHVYYNHMIDQRYNNVPHR
ncbi:MAG: hypothetical protein N2554_04480 [Fimbriimonadales bacterium]|nr:hypothetical protein [Fimbriimonadales bacterium]